MDVFRWGLCLLIIGGAAAQVQLEPQDAVFLRGSQGRFNCTTTQTQSMTWTLNGRLVVTISQLIVQISDARFSATNYTTPGNYKWEFKINSVERSDSGQVTCQVLGAEARVTTLSVQERGTVGIVGGNRSVTEGVQTDFVCQAAGWYPQPTMSWTVNDVVEKTCNSSSVEQGNVINCTLTVTAAKNSSVQCLAKLSSMSSPDSSVVFLTVAPKASTRDQTILIAVTVAFSAAALLFLLIVLIIICCKKRKRRKSTYQEEIIRTQLQSHHRAPATANVRGHHNRGYVTDGRYGDSNGGVWHTNHSNKQQMNYPADDFFDDGFRNDRHMTAL